MQPSAPPQRSVLLRRYGPLIAIVAALVVVAAVVLVTRSSSPKTHSNAAKTTAHSTGALSWAQAAAEGKTKSTDWGSRCDTTTGKLKIPYYFAGQCYAPFKGNNGGATYQGVTANSIKVVLYLAEPHDPVLSYIEGSIADTDTNAQTIATVKGYAKFLQTYYETYGRTIDLIPFVATGPATDDVSARADATTIVETIKPFAVIGGPILTSAFGQEIVANKIFCIDCLPDQPNGYYAANSPYVIGLGMNGDEGQVQLADYIGAQLAGRPAAFAGNSAMHSQKRKFGLVYISTGQESETQTNHFVQSLAKLHVKLAARIAYTSPVTIDSVSIIAKLKAAGVTSVIFSGDPVAPGSLTRAATSQNYFPEWIISGAALTDTTIFARTYDQKQWAHAFGISFLAARTDPKVSGSTYLYHWFYGKNPPAHTGSAVTTPLITLLYVAVQATGPDLTPANLLAALFAAPKPPEALTQPMITYGHHGIWPQTDYLGIDDATEIWWNPKASGPDELNHQGKGMYEYVQGGKRYLPGLWPHVAPDVFTTKGAVTIYETIPPAERVPNYPSPHAG
ncbi:MAG TPA: hypothetical protein VEV63_03435 [Streptosporangiaceae bacterium]|nr:hypothetical protein [Streptosporangiaceae bacterium]